MKGVVEMDVQNQDCGSRGSTVQTMNVLEEKVGIGVGKGIRFYPD